MAPAVTSSQRQMITSSAGARSQAGGEGADGEVLGQAAPLRGRQPVARGLGVLAGTAQHLGGGDPSAMLRRPRATDAATVAGHQHAIDAGVAEAVGAGPETPLHMIPVMRAAERARHLLGRDHPLMQRHHRGREPKRPAAAFEGDIGDLAAALQFDIGNAAEHRHPLAAQRELQRDALGEIGRPLPPQRARQQRQSGGKIAARRGVEQRHRPRPGGEALGSEQIDERPGAGDHQILRHHPRRFQQHLDGSSRHRARQRPARHRHRALHRASRHQHRTREHAR
ncbi:MAG: hypothetical protein NT133_00760 [Alphaproteobacteria bacterium]|nr:hypothetical protein [Alphaproteobacteria bacterium]